MRKKPPRQRKPTQGALQQPVITENLPGEPRVIEREDHAISRDNIDSDALKVLYRLIRHGHNAYLVGGSVRDLCLGKSPKDFDIGTSATPEDVRELFRNSRIIGRRFRMVHVYFRGRKIIEVSTFRKETDEVEDDDGSLLITSDNTFGDARSDALRRDLTINGLMYDVSTFSVIDYIGGMDDLKNGVVRMIGDPTRRFKEDPVRMLRAVRHAAGTGFKIHPETYESLCDNYDLIKLSARARVFEEFLSELKRGHAAESMTLLRDTKLLDHVMPIFAEMLRSGGDVVWRRLQFTLGRLDTVASEGVELEPGMLFAALFIGTLSELELDQESELVDVLDCFRIPSERQAPDEGQPLGSAYVSRSELRKIIFDVLQPAGMSRKERENMERLLLARQEMLYRDSCSFPQLAPAVVQLFWLTEHDADTARRRAYWDRALRDGTIEEDGSNRKGGRRRSRRRRGRRRSRRGGRAEGDGGES